MVRVAAFVWAGAALLGRAHGGSEFGQPKIKAVSATCATIELTHTPAEGQTEPLTTAYVFAKQPSDKDFGQWGFPVSLMRVASKGTKGQNPDRYHALMRDLPAGADFEIKVSQSNNFLQQEASPISVVAKTHSRTAAPAAPSRVEVKRTDLRINKPPSNFAAERDSVCVDLEWSHPNMELARHPSDAYFRVLHQYKGESPVEFCEDSVGTLHHQCGNQLSGLSSAIPTNFATICGLRPQRWIRFFVQAFNCDSPATPGTSLGGNQTGVSSAYVDVELPPSAPSVITSIVAHPGNQKAVSGFRPKAILDWIPENSDQISGHAVYLGLVHVWAIKLLCWVPHNNSKYAKGHLEMLITHKNHTFSKDTLLLQDYLGKYHVHHEQELIVTTRTTDGLESPAYVHRLGEWLVMEEALKCLSSFEAKHPTYVARDFGLTWTQEMALSLYD